MPSALKQPAATPKSFGTTPRLIPSNPTLANNRRRIERKQPLRTSRSGRKTSIAAAARSADTKDRHREKAYQDDGTARPPSGKPTTTQGNRTTRPRDPRARERTPDVAAERQSHRDAGVPAGLAERRASRKRPSHLSVVLVVVPLLVIATVAWRSWRQRREKYPLIAETGRIEGIAALDEGNFGKAHQLLSAAKAAVNALGGAVEDAEVIRNAADEAAIFDDRIPRTLEEMLEEAGRYPERWPSQFDAVYKGRAILIQSHIAAEPVPGGSPAYQIDYMVFPPGAASNFNDQRAALPPRYAKIDLTGFRLFELARPTKGTRVTFGARLASFAFDAQNDVWLIGLEPESGVFIIHHKALEALGWQDAIEADAPPEIGP